MPRCSGQYVINRERSGFRSPNGPSCGCRNIHAKVRCSSPISIVDSIAARTTFCDGPRCGVPARYSGGSQPRLERIRPDDCARVGEIDHLVRGRVIAWPLCPPAAVRIADLGERRPIDARQRTHCVIGGGCLVATIAAGVAKVQGISKPCIVLFSSARCIGKAIPPTQITREIAKDHLYFCHNVRSLLPQVQ